MRFGVIDLETKGLGGDIVAVGIYDGRKFRAFSNLHDALSFIDKRFWTRIWYAHNGGNYDFRYFLDDAKIVASIDRSSILMINGRMVAFRLRSGLEFRDSYALLPESLNALAEGFGFKGKKAYDDYENHADEKKLYEYLKYDCELTHQILMAFANELPVEPRMTIAATALRVWRSMYPKLWRWLRNHKLTRAATEFLREGYYGGRVEVFRQMGTGLNYYDVNSMYPAEMLKPVPWGYWTWVSGAFARRSMARGIPGFYQAKVTVPNMNIPPLPKRRDGKLLFPTGRIKGVWALPEIEYAMTLGVEINHVTKGLIFKESKVIFEDYVKRFWSMKNESKGAKRVVAKLMLNSCYGKFGMRSKFSTIIGPQEAMERMRLGESIEEFDRDLGLYVAEDIARRDFIRPEIAAYITARARVHLHRGMAWLESNGNSVYYCDTDSIITDYNGKSLAGDFKCGEALGEWEYEKSIMRGIFLAPKTYILLDYQGGTETALKGIPSEVSKNFTPEIAATLIRGEKKSEKMVVPRLVGLAEATRRLDTRRAPHKYRAMIQRERSVRVNIDKRRKGADFKTHPRRLKEWG